MIAVPFARGVFLLAGVYGLAALIPHYWMTPPAENPSFFYGFVGVAIAWQAAFLLIAKDPVRYRLIILPGILEKLLFAGAALVLLQQGRASQILLVPAVIDLVLAALFFASYRMLKSE